MSLFSKPRTNPSSEASQRPSLPAKLHPNTAVAAPSAGACAAAAGFAPTSSRQSNGLKEFLWQLDGIGHGHLLDLGPARQTTITFFIERNFKVYTEDLLATWKNFLDEDDLRVKKLPADADRSEFMPEARASRFLETTLLYPLDTFDAVLMWDMLDYLDTNLMIRLAARITSLLRAGGVVFAMFHARKPTLFHRYRVLDGQNLELLPASCPFQPQRVFQNREISNLFCRYRTSKVFVGRDQIREGLFVK